MNVNIFKQRHDQGSARITANW